MLQQFEDFKNDIYNLLAFKGYAAGELLEKLSWKGYTNVHGICRSVTDFLGVNVDIERLTVIATSAKNLCNHLASLDYSKTSDKFYEDLNRALFYAEGDLERRDEKLMHVVAILDLLRNTKEYFSSDDYITNGYKASYPAVKALFTVLKKGTK